ncbi:hypothetical protein [Amycolatopsis azurea]|uniref:Uncharacterized protein n=1 Tax=Amycolatopsis azurea DSM 43854 TaxID=1238180 RepID=M2PU81_9PSEU|nr:hypothetical protein [Amycolatopsis azurea]EMD28163.1 hypothetical protein C791_1370 [Amycolatopsis azurea DSM 43854]OOC01297.1 hypothetical protein B0293_37465 [Amycolatopsis azurea DSM 43854]
MSAADRQRTCAACGSPFAPRERTGLEAVIDGEVLYVAVHPWHSTHPPRRETEAARRLTTTGPA